MTLCDTCSKADVNCPIYPQETTSCVEYTEAKVKHTQGKWTAEKATEPHNDFNYWIRVEGYGCLGYWKAPDKFYKQQWVLKKEDVQLIAAAPELLELLKELEWRAFNTEWSMVCPLCGETKYSGHAEDCKLGNLLKRLEN